MPIDARLALDLDDDGAEHVDPERRPRLAVLGIERHRCRDPAGDPVLAGLVVVVRAASAARDQRTHLRDPLGHGPPYFAARVSSSRRLSASTSYGASASRSSTTP